MAITREELKKLVLQEMQQNQVDEGVGDWFRQLRQKTSSGLVSGGKFMQSAGEKVAPPPQLDDKTLRKVGDFLQMAQRDPELTKLILQTPFGKTVFGSDEKEKVTEALGQDFIKMIKDKKVTPQMLTGFIDAMKASPKAQKMMTGLGLVPKDNKPTQSTAEKPAEKPVTQQTQAGDVPVSDSDIVATEPAAQQVSDTEAKPKKFLPPEEDTPKPTAANVRVRGNSVSTDNTTIQVKKAAKGKGKAGQQATAIAKDTANDIAALLKKQADTGLDSREKNKLIKLLIKNPDQTVVKEAIIEEIYNLLTGKTK